MWTNGTLPCGDAPGQVAGQEDQDEGQPGPQDAAEHLEASLQEECDDKDVE